MTTTQTDTQTDPYENVGFVRAFAKICATERAAQEERFDALARISEPGFVLEEKHYPKTMAQTKQDESDRADMLIVLAANEFGGPEFESMDADLFTLLVDYCGRIYGPRALYYLDEQKALAPEAYATSVPYVWSLAEFPGNSLTVAQWRPLWLKAGFTIDGEPADRPAEPLTLYRASWPQHKRHMSWTDDRSRAEWFKNARSGNQRLYVAQVPPERLLARIHETGRGESEWIVDTRTVQIKGVTS